MPIVTRKSADGPPVYTPEKRTLGPTAVALPKSGLDTELGSFEPQVRRAFRGRIPPPKPEWADALTATYRSILDPEYVVGPSDDRVRVTDTTQSPWRQICSLRIRLKDNRRLVGTGWLIGRNTIITAGHCVFPHIRGSRTDPDYRYNDWAAEIEIYPGANGLTTGGKPRSPVTPARSTSFEAPENWWQHVDEEWDFGAIFIPNPPADWDSLGYFAFAAYGDADLEDSMVNVAGYPTDKTDPVEVGTQWSCAQKVVRVTRRRLYYEVDTFAGQSGSPVFLQLPISGKTKTVAVGVHNYGDRGGVANSGARITKDLFLQLKEWKLKGRNG
ncbi:MAG: trypsin-like peptidase domain-containing protein [Polyangiaceae bacterium]|nr:trypsin-like peptidase domain-containing protein [Polyangiaceae bacterium]